MAPLYTLLPRFFLLLSSTIHLYVGLAFFVEPESWMRMLEINALTDPGLTELKTIYGGVLVALGALFLYGACVESAIGMGLLVMGVTYGGAVVARSIGIFWFEAYNSVILDIYAVEVGGLMSSLVGWWLFRRGRIKAQSIHLKATY